MPLVGTACGPPKGIPFAGAEPTKNLVRLDPYDRTHANQTGVIAGASGAGKTMTAQMMISRGVMHGAQADVIDRAGHFETLVSLVTGAQAVNLGAEDSEYAINPWDVADNSKFSKEKVAFLIGLHASLTGEEGLTAYIAHKAMLYEQRLGGAGGRKIVSASHNAASKTLESAAFFTPRTPEEASFMKTDAGTAYVLLYRQHPLPYIVTPRQ